MLTNNYARITCEKCGKELQILLPGKPFKEVKKCNCSKADYTLDELREMCTKQNIEFLKGNNKQHLKKKLGIA